MESLLFPLLLVLLGGFMFLSMRKQKKRMTEMQDMQNSVQTGSRIQLTSGLYGTVIDASSPEFIDVEIATGVVTRWNRLAIMKLVPTEEAAATYPGYVAPDADSFETLTDEDLQIQDGPAGSETVTFDKVTDANSTHDVPADTTDDRSANGGTRGGSTTDKQADSEK
ncbi:hypothetical protein GCM10009624_10930 [Gordonia sinesedis]